MKVSRVTVLSLTCRAWVKQQEFYSRLERSRLCNGARARDAAASRRHQSQTQLDIIRGTKKLAHPQFLRPIHIFHDGFSEHMPVELLGQINPNHYAVKFAGQRKGTLDEILKGVRHLIL